MGSFPETYNNPHEVCLRVWLLPSVLDASPSQGYPPAVCREQGMSPRPPDPEFEELIIIKNL